MKWMDKINDRNEWKKVYEQMKWTNKNEWMI